jgi:ankyrin repeat protein
MRITRRPALLLAAVLAAPLAAAQATTSLATADLLAAARTGQAERIDDALKRGADPNARDTQGSPALVLATASQSRAAVDVLLGAGADPRLQDHTWTPLLMAVLRDDRALVDRLLAAGAPPNAWDSRQVTPLMLAAGLGHEALVTRLLATEGGWAEAKDLAGATALHYAANNGQLATVQLLVPRLGAGGPDRHGNTPASLARRNGFEDVARLLDGTGAAGRK